MMFLRAQILVILLAYGGLRIPSGITVYFVFKKINIEVKSLKFSAFVMPISR